ncbi:MAG: hypothetical protein SGI77_24975 [Pirellulaceae bacterium]|nr:hypothetical protein [Pirellulaceae bacterium]
MVAFKRGENRIRRRANAFRDGYSSAVFFTVGVLVGCIGSPS